MGKADMFFYEKHSSPPLPCVGDFNNFLNVICLTIYYAFTSVVGRGTKIERQEAAIVCGHRGVTCVTQKAELTKQLSLRPRNMFQAGIFGDKIRGRCRVFRTLLASFDPIEEATTA
jgi:hypothetical protein